MAISDDNKDEIFNRINDINNSIVSNQSSGESKNVSSQNNEGFSNSNTINENISKETTSEFKKDNPVKKPDNLKLSKIIEDQVPQKNKKKSKRPSKPKKARYQFILYVVLWVGYFYSGVVLPLYLLAQWFTEIFIPHFIEATPAVPWRSFWDAIFYPSELFSTFGSVLQDPLALASFLLTPLVLTGIYLLKMFCYALIMKFYYWLLNLVRSRKELKNAPPWGKTKRDIEIYYARNVMLRIIKWEFTKSPFPWLTPWMFNFIGSNKLGKGTVIEDSYIAQEFLETGENVYMGFGHGSTSHLVEGSYGALTVKTIKLGSNVVVGSRCAIPPGVEFKDDSQILWYSGVIKNQKVKSGVQYWGLPASRLTKRKYKKLIKFPDEFNPKKKSDGKKQPKSQKISDDKMLKSGEKK